MATRYHYSVENVNGLTDEEILKHVPSIFGQVAHESRSARYKMIPTSDVLTALREHDFAPTLAMQSRSRGEHGAVTRHLLRLRRVEDLGYRMRWGDQKQELHEVVLVNAHDGSSSYQLSHGVYRLVCKNGLVIGKIQDAMRIRHVGPDDIVGQVVEGSLELLKESKGVMEMVEEMKHIQLSRVERLMLAEQAASIRLPESDEGGEDEDEGKSVWTADPREFLRVQRGSDLGDDLWTTTNVAQEHMIRGGVTAHDQHGKRRHLRGITSIDSSQKMNRALMQFSKRLLDIKAGRFTDADLDLE